VTERDWFAVLKSALDTETTVVEMSPDDVDTMIADIVAGRIHAVDRSKPRRARRRWITVGTTITLFAGGATAAAMWNARPERPHEGISCHASADVSDVGVVVRPPAADAIDACSELWRTGALPSVVQDGLSQGTVPSLFACVGSGGGLEVFPNLVEPDVSCSDLGLVEALNVGTDDPLVALQARLANDINSKCVDLPRAQQLAQAVVSDLGLAGWDVTIREHAVGCVKAGQDPESRTIYLFTPPNQQQP
jgi:hypothetical protein